MEPTANAKEAQKQAAAELAVDQVRSGMALGLGTGSTARYAIQSLGARTRAGRLQGLVCVPTSEDTARRAQAEGLTLSDLTQHPVLQLAIDGADEFDPQLNLIKGLGGAMLREKRVARAAQRFVVFVDETKRVSRLGTLAPLPIELGPESVNSLSQTLSGLGGLPAVRGGAQPFRTDNGNVIIDCRFVGGIPDAAALARQLDADARVLAHGLFLGMTSELLMGSASGVVRITRSAP